MKKNLPLLGLLALVWVLACGGAKDAGGGAGGNDAPKAAEMKVTALELATAYEDNEVAADGKYKGKRLAVTGKVSDVGEVFGQKSVTLEGKNLSLASVQCFVADKDKDGLLKLKKGNSATIEGTCEGKGLNVTLQNCVVK
jgi:hypothetical protein